MAGATMEHFIPGKVTGTRTVRVRDREYERLRAMGTVRESFSDVIERLLDFYEAYNGGVHSNDPEGFEGADLPENPVFRRVALDHFTRTLALGEDVSFTIGFDPLASPLGRRGKGLVAFYKDGRRFCLFRVGKEHLWLYFPTERRDTELDGWELVQNVLLDNYLEDGGMHLIRRQYQTM